MRRFRFPNLHLRYLHLIQALALLASMMICTVLDVQIANDPVAQAWRPSQDLWTALRIFYAMFGIWCLYQMIRAYLKYGKGLGTKIRKDTLESLQLFQNWINNVMDETRQILGGNPHIQCHCCKEWIPKQYISSVMSWDLKCYVPVCEWCVAQNHDEPHVTREDYAGMGLHDVDNIR